MGENIFKNFNKGDLIPEEAEYTNVSYKNIYFL